MDDDPHSDEEIIEILKMKKVAVVGMSKNPDKAAHYVPKYLHENGYDITPVNPNADVIPVSYTHLTLPTKRIV